MAKIFLNCEKQLMKINSFHIVFAIQNGGACFSGPNAESTYKRYGASDACKGGRGGAFANSVYKLFDDGITCFDRINPLDRILCLLSSTISS